MTMLLPVAALILLIVVWNRVIQMSQRVITLRRLCQSNQLWPASIALPLGLSGM